VSSRPGPSGRLRAVIGPGAQLADALQPGLEIDVAGQLDVLRKRGGPDLWARFASVIQALPLRLPEAAPDDLRQCSTSGTSGR